MFEMLSYLHLQQLWWIIISLLGGLFVFLLFVQGGQTLLFSLPTNDVEKSMLVNTLGRKWELTFTTLVLFGGANFAAFPHFYAVSFGGAYWVWLIILICFVIQAVSYEYRTKPNNFLGQRVFETFLFINGTLGVFLIGAALSTFFNGAEFTIDSNRFVEWNTNLRGLEALFHPTNYLLGIALIFLSRITGLMYAVKTIESQNLADRAYKFMKRDTIFFLVFFLAFLGWIFFKSGYAYDSNMVVTVESHKYMKNLMAMPIVAIMLIVGVVLVLLGIFTAIFKRTENSIWLNGIGTVLTAMSLLLIAGLNNTPFYPSIPDMQASLTIQNASSSHYTLITMSYVALLVPVVLAYIVYAWSAMNKTKITPEEVGEHKDAY